MRRLQMERKEVMSVNEPLFHQPFVDWLHDDITWCSNTECGFIDCVRNQVNRRNKEGLFSMADFAGTDDCPLEHMKNQRWEMTYETDR